MINSVLIKYHLRKVIKIMNMKLLFEFEDYQAETSGKLSCIEIQKDQYRNGKRLAYLLSHFCLVCIIINSLLIKTKTTDKNLT